MWFFRVNLSPLVYLLILQGTGVFFCSWYMKINSCSSTPPNDKVHVLLLSSWRSGSSSLGQVFSQHPSVFYLKEPAWHVWTRLHKTGAGTLRMAVRDMLWSVLKCDLSVMEAYLPEQHNVSMLYMWLESRALCSPPACPLTPHNQFSYQNECEKRCDAQGLQGVQAACGTYSHIVLKEVRVFELESLYPLLRDPKIDLRIIHLVRDPRAVLQSREAVGRLLAEENYIMLEKKKTPAAELVYRVLQRICRSHIHIIEKVYINPPPFLKGRVKVVRYEDVTRNPLEEIHQIYEFVGLKMTTELEKMINHVTNAWDEEFKITSRNATDVSQAWRNTLPHDKVKKVQEVCGVAMRLLGYRAVDNEKEQKSLEVDLLEPIDFSETG